MKMTKARVIEVTNGVVTKAEDKRGWKIAVKELLRLNPKAGYVITPQWLADQFGLVAPTAWTRKEWGEYQFKFLHNMEKFRDALLEEHRIDLRRVKNKGYEILHPKEQTLNAMTEGLRAIAKTLNRTTMRVLHVDTSKLSKRQLQENAEALNKLSVLRTAFTKHRRLSHRCYKLLDNKLKEVGYESEE